MSDTSPSLAPKSHKPRAARASKGYGTSRSIPSDPNNSDSNNKSILSPFRDLTNSHSINGMSPSMSPLTSPFIKKKKSKKACSFDFDTETSPAVSKGRRRNNKYKTKTKTSPSPMKITTSLDIEATGGSWSDNDKNRDKTSSLSPTSLPTSETKPLPQSASKTRKSVFDQFEANIDSTTNTTVRRKGGAGRGKLYVDASSSSSSSSSESDDDTQDESEVPLTLDNNNIFDSLFTTLPSPPSSPSKPKIVPSDAVVIQATDTLFLSLPASSLTTLTISSFLAIIMNKLEVDDDNKAEIKAIVKPRLTLLLKGGVKGVVEVVAVKKVEKAVKVKKIKKIKEVKAVIEEKEVVKEVVRGAAKVSVFESLITESKVGEKRIEDDDLGDVESAEESASESEAEEEVEPTKTKPEAEAEAEPESDEEDDELGLTKQIKEEYASKQQTEDKILLKSLNKKDSLTQEEKQTRNRIVAALELAESTMEEEDVDPEEAKRQEAIHNLFDTRTQDRLIASLADRSVMISKLKEKFDGKRLALLDKAELEYIMLRDEAMDKKKKGEVSVIKGPVLGVCFSKNMGEKMDLDDSDSDSDFEFVPDQPPITIKPPSPPLSSSQSTIKPQVTLPPPSKFMKKKAPISNRKLLKAQLVQKSNLQGNKWLAKELEYDNWEEHVRECKILEVRRRRGLMKELVNKEKIEKGRVELHEELWGGEIGQGELEGEMEGDESSEGEGEGQFDDDNSDNEEEDGSDDELSGAEDDEIKKVSSPVIEKEKELAAADDAVVAVEVPVMSIVASVESVDSAPSSTPPPPSSSPPSLKKAGSDDDEGDGDDESGEKGMEGDDDDSDNEMEVTKATIGESKKETGIEGASESEADEQEEESQPETQAQIKQKRINKNAQYKAMLLKDMQSSKSKKKSSMVDEEAEEEEEDEGVQGLEDFGFGSKKVNDGEDDEFGGGVTKDDLENIVDQLSDDEGDEDAGNAARMTMEQKEEKERHKEMMKRMQEGYDGRKGGVAGGARGKKSYDQLVSADNRKDAKRLGLLGSDEEDSDNEEGEEEKGEGEDEEEDETAFLDAMLKERHLGKKDQQQYYDESSSSEEEDDAAKEGDMDSDEEKELEEQNKIAKRIRERAKMQRVLAEFDDSQSQSMLIDDDEDFKADLGAIKSMNKKKRNANSDSQDYSQGGSQESFFAQERETAKPHSHSQSQKASFFQTAAKRSKSEPTQTATQAPPPTSMLSIALAASRKGVSIKKKTVATFLNKKNENGNWNSSSTSSAGRKTLALNHVMLGVMPGGKAEDANSQFSRDGFGTSSTTTNNNKSNQGASNSVTPSVSKPTLGRTESNSSSLWSKIQANNGFRAVKK